MPTSHIHKPHPFLVFPEKSQDAKMLDAAIAQEKLGYRRLGDATYLAFLFDELEVEHGKLKDLGVEGSIQWIALTQAIRTRG